MAVGPAAAQVTAHCAQDVGFFGGIVLVEQGFHAHDLARRAKAALVGVGFDKGLLNRIEVIALSDAFDSGYLLALAFDTEHEAGIHCLTV